MTMRLSAGAALPHLAACSDPPKPPPPPAEDTAVADTTPAAPPPRRAASKIGQMQLLSALSGDGECVSRVGANRSAAFVGGFPPRTIGVDVGAGARDFAPTTLRVEMKELAGTDQEEKESIYVLFGASGNIERGSRDYSNARDPKAAEHAELLPNDSMPARQLALSVAERCK
jgi:hypothetical protein